MAPWKVCTCRLFAPFFSLDKPFLFKNSVACSASSSVFFNAVSPTTSNSPAKARSTSSVCVPMEPVEPKMAIFCMMQAESMRTLRQLGLRINFFYP